MKLTTVGAPTPQVSETTVTRADAPRTVQVLWGVFVKPKLTPFAAFGLMLVMILAAVFHIVRGEYNFVPINRVLSGVAAFIA